MAINSFRLAVAISEIEKQQPDMALRWVMLKMWLEKEEAAQQSMHTDAACACPDDGNLQINSDFVCAVCHKTPRR